MTIMSSATSHVNITKIYEEVNSDHFLLNPFSKSKSLQFFKISIINTWQTIQIFGENKIYISIYLFMNS